MKNLRLFSWIQVAVIIICLLCRHNISSAQQENLNVFERWIEWTDGDHMLIHHLNDKAFLMLDERDRKVADLKTKEDWINRQQEVKVWTQIKSMKHRLFPI